MKKIILLLSSVFAALVALRASGYEWSDSNAGVKYTYESVEGGLKLSSVEVLDAEQFTGALNLPESLPVDDVMRPLTVIGTGAIGGKSLNEVRVPSTITAIDSGAIFKGSAITNITFACNKPTLAMGWTGELRTEVCVFYILPSARGWGKLPGVLTDPIIEDGQVIYEPEFKLIPLGLNPDNVVTISPESGVFREEDRVKVQLSQTVIESGEKLQVRIYYTTDGSEPDESSSVFTEDSPLIRVTSTTTIKAFLAVYQIDKTGEESLYEVGPTAEATYQFPQPNGGPYTEEVDGITWTYMVKNGSAIIERVSFEKPAVPVETAGELVLPAELGLRSVTGIGVSAFERCRYLTKVTFPETISTIASFAFKDCLRLKELVYLGTKPDVDLAAFDGCPLAVEPLPSIKVKVALPIEIQADDEGDIELPENWLDLMAEIHGGGTWKTQFTERFGEGTTDTLKKETGKVDCAGNRLQVWQEYVAGTDPLDAESKLLASVEMTDDGPVITWTPDLSSKGRIYTIYGMKNLTDKQKAVDVTAMTPGEIKSAGYRFFFMSVRLAPEEVSE